MISLKKNTDFKRVYESGSSRGSRAVVVYAARNGLTASRLGISVSKRVGNSVVRHRIKRLVREYFRLHEEEITQGYDFVAVGRPAAKGMDFREVSASCEKCLKAHGVLSVGTKTE